MNDRNGLVAVVLGSSSGIGNACARALSTNGFLVFGVARTVDDEASFVQHRADLSTPLGTKSVENLILETNPDAIIFSVGENTADSISNFGIEDVRRLLEVNALSVLHPLKIIATKLPVKSRSVVLISSVHARGQVDRLSYSISKGALETIMASTSEYLMKIGIRINCIRPGPTETRMLQQNYPLNSSERNAYQAKIPAGRFAQPHEIVGLVQYLISEQASHITGQTVGISGGF